jgi:hypothetical protein
MATTWTVSDALEFWGRDFQTWKSDTGEWAYGYGTEIGGELYLESLVTGFATEQAAIDAAYDYGRELAQESACEANF